MDAVKTLNYIQFMNPLEEQMGFYAAYRRNRATHFVGVPAIIAAPFIPSAWIGSVLFGFA
jgi:hypothetical protein